MDKEGMSIMVDLFMMESFLKVNFMEKGHLLGLTGANMKETTRMGMHMGKGFLIYLMVESI